MTGHFEIYSGSQIQEAFKVPAVQGQSKYCRVADRTAQGRVGGIDRRRLSGDRDRLRLRSRAAES